MGNLLNQISKELFDGFKVNIYQTKNRHRELVEYTVTEENNSTVYSYAVGEEIRKVELKFIENENNVTVFIDAIVDNGNWCAGNFRPEKTVGIKYSLDYDKALGSTYFGRWWKTPVFFDKNTGIDNIPMQNLLLKKGDLHYEILPLVGNNFRTEIWSDEIFLTTDMSGVYHISGPVMTVSVSDNPLTALHNAYSSSRQCGGIMVPLKKEKKYPEILNGFGFCTWDCFYHEVSSEKIYTKLAEMNDKNIPVQWIMIDDGWMTTDGGYLTSFKEDPQKFPNGLKDTIETIKNKYGVKYVGVWHTINGYWDGVKEGSELFNEQRENIFETQRGRWVPSLITEKGTAFWNSWYAYLTSCGVDFVKVDSQASVPLYYEGTMETAKASRLHHLAFEKAIFNNFKDGCVINCMGMEIENLLNRPYSAVNRNSDDFSPRNEKDFHKHITHNVFNSIWHDELYYCDYDMWWSDHFDSIKSGVLRAISGSPVYVSDEVGRSDPEKILPVIENNGELIRCDNASKPTIDCLYSDSRVEDKILTVFNTSGDNVVLAAFNLREKELTEEFDFSNLKCIVPGKQYYAYEYFTKEWIKVDSKSKLSISITPDQVRIWSIYPVNENGQIYAGDLTKYVSCATKEKTLINPIV